MQGMTAKAVLLLTAMTIAAVVAHAVRPDTTLADTAPLPDLELMVPESFGRWRLDPAIVPQLPDPTTAFYVRKFYTRTLARTYIADDGRRVMLSIAYGGTQTDSLRVHKPEVCYAAGGFDIRSLSSSQLRIDRPNLRIQIPVRRMHAARGLRQEPVTYWMTIGSHIALTGLGQKLAQLRYSLRGEVPDGLLFRVSSIGDDIAKEFSVQDEFLAELLSTLSATARHRFVGTPIG